MENEILKPGDIRTWTKTPADDAIKIADSLGCTISEWDFEILEVYDDPPARAFCALNLDKQPRIRHGVTMLIADILRNSVAKKDYSL